MPKNLPPLPLPGDLGGADYSVLPSVARGPERKKRMDKSFGKKADFSTPAQKGIVEKTILKQERETKKASKKSKIGKIEPSANIPKPKLALALSKKTPDLDEESSQESLAGSPRAVNLPKQIVSIQSLFASLPQEAQLTMLSKNRFQKGQFSISIEGKMEGVSPSAYKLIHQAVQEVQKMAHEVEGIAHAKLDVVVAVSKIEIEEPNKVKLEQKLRSAASEMQIAKVFHELDDKGIAHPHLLATTACAYRFKNGALHIFTLMPKMSGGSFEEMKNDPDLNRRFAACKQFVDGLNQLHGLRIVHGDIKPANALLESKETLMLKIIDWGTHANFNNIEQENAETFAYNVLRTLGSEMYNAPERIAASEVRLNGEIKNRSRAADIAKAALYLEGKEIVDPHKVEGFVKKAEVFSICMSLYEIVVGDLPEYIKAVRQPTFNMPAAMRNDVIIQALQKAEHPPDLPEEAILKATRREGLQGASLKEFRQTPDYQNAKAYLELLWRGLSFNPNERPSMQELALASSNAILHGFRF